MSNLKKEVEKFVIEVNMKIAEYYEKNYPRLEVKKVEVKENQKYFKLISNNSVWGFVSKYNGIMKGSYVKEGDLLKAASWSSPAKHARGNILDGTESYSTYGPSYLK